LPDVVTQGPINRTHTTFFYIDSTSFGPTIGLENIVPDPQKLVPVSLCFADLPSFGDCLINLTSADLVVAGGLHLEGRISESVFPYRPEMVFDGGFRRPLPGHGKVYPSVRT
jgi:hypothetical protein